MDEWKELVEQLKKTWQSDEESRRRTDSAKLLAFFLNDWRGQLERELQARFAPETYDKLKLGIDDSWNLAKWAAGEIGAIYSGDVVRTIDDEPVPSQYESDLSLDLALSTAASLLPLVGNLFLHPMATPVSVIDEAGLSSTTYELSLDVITPDRVAVIENDDDDDPHGIKAIAYLVDDGDRGRFVIWSDKWHGSLSTDWEALDEPVPNPYGLLPVVPVRSEWRVGPFFAYKGGEGLRRATIEAGVSLSQLSFMLKVASHKQPWVSGEPHKDFPLDAILDGVTPIVMGSGGSIGQLDLTTDLTKTAETIFSRAAAVLNLYGIRPEALKGSIDAASGYALRLKMTSLERVWGEQRRLWTLWETDLYNVGTRVLERSMGEVLPQGTLNIIWPDVGPQQSKQELANLYLPMVRDGTIPKYYANMRIEGLSEERAKALADEAAAEQAASIPTLPAMLPTDPS